MAAPDPQKTYEITAGPENPEVLLLLAQGAGAGVDAPFLTAMTELLVARGIAVTRFEFPYMAARRSGGKKRPPPSAEALTEVYRAMIDDVRLRTAANVRLLIGGKSLGGRVASLVADEAFAAGKISGLVCLGYPFHPIGKPDQLRTAHLGTLTCPALIVQGERDPFGHKAEVDALTLSPAIAVHFARDGDHDLGPRGNSGFTRKGNLSAAADAIAAFAAPTPAAR